MLTPASSLTFSWLDMLIMGLMLISMAWGAWRGLIYELLSIGNWIFSFFFAHILSDTFVPYTYSWTYIPAPWRVGVIYVVLFVIALFIGGWIASRIREWISHTGLRATDRVLGALFGWVRALIIALALSVVMHIFKWHEHDFWQLSVLTHWVDALLNGLQPWLGTSINQVI